MMDPTQEDIYAPLPSLPPWPMLLSATSLPSSQPSSFPQYAALSFSSYPSSSLFNISNHVLGLHLEDSPACVPPQAVQAAPSTKHKTQPSSKDPPSQKHISKGQPQGSRGYTNIELSRLIDLLAHAPKPMGKGKMIKMGNLQDEDGGDDSDVLNWPTSDHEEHLKAVQPMYLTPVTNTLSPASKVQAEHAIFQSEITALQAQLHDKQQELVDVSCDKDKIIEGLHVRLLEDVHAHLGVQQELDMMKAQLEYQEQMRTMMMGMGNMGTWIVQSMNAPPHAEALQP
ncbi:hypothetical protein DACRYDRAFT_18908 [Dacryopinax primogenitus]|uniref:Uncharacterized protein n=1 Tax=Dacryopinax primogenitus (strain DJM 731) TaxID=1858805 RepID=M5G095_DACPD|nr:uncharacterized protein DACRYDRAFT_18908 [Dacryopinax primogenitus]EJT97197.1 hypothetical protein DACRYDRAFT_18908 [Dacryopinax primogenitus]